MNEIEADLTSAKRKTTGSKFSISIVPPEFSKWECRYENPTHGLCVDFHAKWIREEKAIERNGKTTMRGIITGAILVKGERKNALAKALGSRANDDEIDQFVRDCYELISEQMIAQSDLNRLGVKPHIYAAKPEPSGYGALTGSSEITEVGPDGVARSHAELVF